MSLIEKRYNYAPTAWSPHAAYLGELATWALEQEARLSPKPALVDSRGDGAHSDMNLALMLSSARCLEPWFARMAEAALTISSDAELRECIGRLGREAEAEMLSVTDGINTHRGAIWALGLIVTAAATVGDSESDLFNRTAQLARLPDPSAPAAKTVSNGEKVAREFRLPGAREQAQQGFPHLHQMSLPTLRKSRANGDVESVAQLNALLSIMTALTDTCVLSRAGLAGLSAMQQGAAAVLKAGGCGSFAGRRALAQLESQLLSLNASAGGAADLLAATLLVDRLFPDAIR
ncbi:2-(5''-triphosphoribosyl)-3'-dephosphocoenzyme-A synthase [Marinobacterium zhoushanense]|uniref:Probable 2-(5''-triphosphoribosyl)-3'-dephosphocoenzyme-A synthase n=1 Tax=Marinobacterium zhoushanense TaxID=1679163 RepID=A0ABQ1K1V3_9GAMM|nr:triphosphoribosyl-dephospho-CoA synthase [Marinobacterium zhoushanense]GGB82619.1 2-(5''-triphosphoribosyl)-3'-dephosphocoenzyme-A synthase [Marinobacterium zhoushanense]